MQIRRRKGAIGKQFMGFSYLFLLLFVGVGIVVGAGIFYGRDIDVRGQESSQMAERIQECILSKNVDWNVVRDDNNLFYEQCKLNQKVVENYYVMQIVKNGREVFHLKDATACDFEGAKNNLYFPKCSAKKFDSNGDKYVVKAGSHQRIRREAS